MTRRKQSLPPTNKRGGGGVITFRKQVAGVHRVPGLALPKAAVENHHFREATGQLLRKLGRRLEERKMTGGS